MTSSGISSILHKLPDYIENSAQARSLAIKKMPITSRYNALCLGTQDGFSKVFAGSASFVNGVTWLIVAKPPSDQRYSKHIISTCFFIAHDLYASVGAALRVASYAFIIPLAALYGIASGFYAVCYFKEGRDVYGSAIISEQQLIELPKNQKDAHDIGMKLHETFMQACNNPNILQEDLVEKTTYEIFSTCHPDVKKMFEKSPAILEFCKRMTRVCMHLWYIAQEFKGLLQDKPLSIEDLCTVEEFSNKAFTNMRNVPSSYQIPTVIIEELEFPQEAHQVV